MLAGGEGSAFKILLIVELHIFSNIYYSILLKCKFTRTISNGMFLVITPLKLKLDFANLDIHGLPSKPEFIVWVRKPS
jgi:hypothetical protein